MGARSVKSRWPVLICSGQDGWVAARFPDRSLLQVRVVHYTRETQPGGARPFTRWACSACLPNYHNHRFFERTDAADMVLFFAGTTRLATGGDPIRLVVSPFP